MASASSGGSTWVPWNFLHVFGDEELVQGDRHEDGVPWIDEHVVPPCDLPDEMLDVHGGKPLK